MRRQINILLPEKEAVQFRAGAINLTKYKSRVLLLEDDKGNRYEQTVRFSDVKYESMVSLSDGRIDVTIDAEATFDLLTRYEKVFAIAAEDLKEGDFLYFKDAQASLTGHNEPQGVCLRDAKQNEIVEIRRTKTGQESN